MNPRIRLVLASRSPRRRALLRSLGFRFCVVFPQIEEAPRPGERPAAFAARAARDKARDVAKRLGPAKGCWILAGDTVVVQGERILGKPRSRAEARAMLRSLSGRTHEVITGVCLLEAGGPGREYVVVARSRVKFRPLAAEEIARYVATGEPMDKAGAYAVQGRARGFIERVSGSYTNVVGLPLEQVRALLRRALRLSRAEKSRGRGSRPDRSARPEALNSSAAAG